MTNPPLGTDENTGMKRTITTSLTLSLLAAISATAGGCIYATHAPGEGTRLNYAPVVVEPAPVYAERAPVYVERAPAVVYEPAPMYYYGPPVSLNFGFGYWGHGGWGHGGHGHH
jgi:hypothetical protein